MTNIPKKLKKEMGEITVHGIIAKVPKSPSAYVLQEKINELIDYLESKQTTHVCNCCKEDVSKASRGECTVVGCEEPMPHLHDFRKCRNPEPHKFGSLPCCEGLSHPESKGECSKCGVEYPIHKGDCPELYPPEHEERLEESSRLDDLAHKFNNTIGIKSGRDQKIVKFYEDEIKSGYVSKEKIKREIDNLIKTKEFNSTDEVSSNAMSSGYRFAFSDLTRRLKI